MGLWHVFYADWQMECCGTPFSLGDEVSWPLLLSDADEVLGGGWHDQLTKIVGPVEDVPGEEEEGASRVVREDTGLVVALQEHPVHLVPPEGPGAVRPGDRIRSVGLLTVQTHGAELPEVRGRVRAIQVLTQGFAEPESGSEAAWEPVPGERWLRSVDRCPKWFTGDRSRSEAGAVVTLEVPGTDSWLSYAVREASGIPHEGANPGAETEGVPPDALAALLETFSRVR
ncbi:hypothetical protein ADK57_38670 [Streptomyces sp. MMG1533]|uniref:DUF6578 domain-containing protein n=1 Tax=Streptomyces sp. MMG1533 TaxID=1415546 RepID=UPI0006ADFAB1|nr:DUF6578 domain-containing protein [Streptomyces sp. MMG1533]KOU57516.1 hypothetical protein ADK57_38670 [Streptomyces sp. MMG1533]